MRAQAPSPDEFGFDLDEDSPDLTETEATTAHVTESADELAAYLMAVRCGTCFEPVMTTAYAMRRRKPHIYSRITVACLDRHTTNLVIRTTWMKPQ